jgi:hypothetical protein
MIQSKNTGIDVSIWRELSPCLTFSPVGLKIIGSPVVLQSLFRIVVLPALARPITRTRNRLNFARAFCISSSVIWSFGEADIAKDARVAVNDLRLSCVIVLFCTALSLDMLDTMEPDSL